MSLLQFIIIVSAVIFVLFGLDLYKRKKMNILHFLVFFFGGGLLIVFALDTQLLNSFGSFFGIARGADLLVYVALILLCYFYISLLNKQTKDSFQLTRLISQTAIDAGYAHCKDQISHWKNQGEKDDFVFNIRAYNEEVAVGKVIDEIVAAGFKKLVLINDGSSDHTLQVLLQKQSQYPDALIIVLSHTINRGGGAANQTGYNFIKTYGDELQVKWFVGFDSDGQMDVKDMDIFMQYIHQDIEAHKHKHVSLPDLYLGSRFTVGGIGENMPRMRKFILAIATLVTKIFYGARMSDPHNGYRVIALSALRRIVLTSDGMHYANEVNEQIKKYHMKYKEVPVHIRYSDYSLQKGQKNSNSLKLAAEMIYKKIFFR